MTNVFFINNETSSHSDPDDFVWTMYCSAQPLNFHDDKAEMTEVDSFFHVANITHSKLSMFMTEVTSVRSN